MERLVAEGEIVKPHRLSMGGSRTSGRYTLHGEDARRCVALTDGLHRGVFRRRLELLERVHARELDDRDTICRRIAFDGFCGAAAGEIVAAVLRDDLRCLV